MEKMNGKTFDSVNYKYEKLKELFPSAFVESKVDLDKLREEIGLFVNRENQEYELKWPGKSEAIKLAQKQTTATLRPSKYESKDWDQTKNIYIEGDNLEVLRVLQSSYNNKVDFIYIDPPYNTGKDFIYKDNYRDNVTSYMNRLENSLKSNTILEGRFHSNWLNFMYPRLKIARNLLNESGYIFISIGDDEYSNLKKICDEIFGEFNFISTTIWNCSTGGGIRPKFFTSTHEYGLVYAKNIKNVQQLNAPLSKEAIKLYTKKDEEGLYREKDFVFRNDSTNDNQKYFIECPDGTKVKPKEGYIYRFIKETFDKALNENKVVFKKTNKGPLVTDEGDQAKWNIYIKKHLGDATGAPTSIIPRDQVGIYNNGTRVVQDLFDGYRVFQNPKPIEYLKYLLSIFAKKEGIVMDFFSGSASFGHAVMEHNLEMGYENQFILVQLPEKINDESDAGKMGFKSICDVGKERLNRSGKEIIQRVGNEVQLDTGYRVFKLDETNLKLWNEETFDIEKSLLDFIEPLKDGRAQEDVVYEIIIKFGIDLAIPVEEKLIEGKRIYSIGMGYLLICLERDLTLEHIEKLAKQQPARIVFYDEGFKDDTVRTNAQQILKKYGVEDIRVI
ncbi:site-specific DNA-methyltransferase [Exiguobacterium qingdaonense]|uniref:site-specific DNA-methyltransferase n=1 Tax=Exiguobacterium qingdaonense TaxID=2751251 RepID=UPI001BE586D5|nr:site-specific DNA-methyltransferase [Exiguobacterium qingdaonense]